MILSSGPRGVRALAVTALAAVLAVLGTLGLALPAAASDAPATPVAGAPAVSAPAPASAPVAAVAPAAVPGEDSGLPVRALSSLPAEASETHDLIRAGGPFPYEQDGTTFQNREGILPAEPRGYYAEYTVDTPGLDHRGARRIVTGSGGEVYYTADHYASFVVVDVSR